MSTGHLIDFTVDKEISEKHWRVNLSQTILDKLNKEK
jgi:hypothetical protein